MNTYHSGLVTSVSIIVPGGGFCKPPPDGAKKRVLILLVTTMTTTFGLKIMKNVCFIKSSSSPNALTDTTFSTSAKTVIFLGQEFKKHTCTVLQGSGMPPATEESRYRGPHLAVPLPHRLWRALCSAASFRWTYGTLSNLLKDHHNCNHYILSIFTVTEPGRTI